jgi:hypothetical protein
VRDGYCFYSWAYPRDAYAASSLGAPYRLGESDVASFLRRLPLICGIGCRGLFCAAQRSRGIYYTRTDIMVNRG